jgi:adenylate cyclase
MATLEAALERAIAGQGGVVGVVAEAGTGKSRLCYEFAEGCRGREIPVREGHGVAHGKMIPFLPVLELLRGLFEIAEQDSPRAARTKIAGALLMLDREFEPALPLMFDFLGVPDPENPAPTLAPDARQRQLFGVVRRIIRARGEREPAVILIEDLHWIDGGSEAFVETAVETVAGTRTLLLVSFRPEYRADWMQKSYYQQIPLLPLGSEALRELLDDLLGRDPSLSGLAERIQERTGGNPFFIEEVVQSLLETGSLAGSRGAYRLVHPVAKLAIPGTVQAVLAARIDRLAEREKRLLQVTSVIGKQFSEGLLERVAELSDSGLSGGDRADALRALVAAEFLYEEALYPEAEYAFKHPLTQEVAYASQLGERRAGVHAAVARAIEARDSDKLDERAALLAHHWEGAGEVHQAARWHRRAAEWAGVSQPSEGFAHWHRVRDLLATLPRSPETDELGAVARSQLLYLGARVAAAPEEMEALFREGSELARRSGNDTALARLSSSYGSFVYVTTGIMEEALGHLFRGVELADRAGDLGLRIAARYTAAFCCQHGHLERALAFTAEGIELAGDDLDVGADLVGYSPWAGHRIVRSAALCFAGRLGEAGALVEAISRFPRERADPVVVFCAPLSAGMRFRSLGDPARAIDQGRQAVELAEGQGSQGSQPMRILGYDNLGASLVLGGRWDEARSAFEHALALIEEGRTFRYYEGLCLARLAEALLGGGELERARDTARAAVRVGARNGWTPECEAQLAVAHVLTRTEGPAAAEQIGRALDRAAELVELSGARSYQPRVHEARAEFARLQGDEARREAELREAHRLYTEMGATGHAQRLARELAESGP